MTSRAPHYLLYSDAERRTEARDRPGGRWRFVLQSVEDDSRLEVQDRERDMTSERLELLAVVRGLEALDQPSRVTLVTSSRYVSRGLRFGLEEWRDNRWRWERHGRMVPIKNNDLWQRIDVAMKYHEVECRIWRFDSAHGSGDRRKPIRPAAPGAAVVVNQAARGSRAEDGRARSHSWLGRWLSGDARQDPRTSAAAASRERPLAEVPA